MSATGQGWPLRRPPQEVLADVLERAALRRRRTRTLRSAAAAAIAVAVAVPAVAQLGSSRDTTVRITDRPQPTAVDVPVGPQPNQFTPGPTTTAASASDPASEHAATVRILTDPEGDATGGGWPSGSRENDPSLDILALDVSSDGRSLTFVQHLAGSPEQDPAGANGRFHLVSFWIPGHDTVQVYAFRESGDTEVWAGVISPDQPAGNKRCPSCSVAFDGPGRRVVLTVPFAALNDLDVKNSGRFDPGVELSGFATSSEWRYAAFGTRTGGEVDDAIRPDGRFRIPEDAG